MIGNYFRIIFFCLFVYTVAYNLLMFFVETHMTKRIKKMIKRIYFSFWLVPTCIYIYIISNSIYAQHYFLRNVLASILFHVLLSYMGYKATLE